jgi:signal transduction histidine kinase
MRRLWVRLTISHTAVAFFAIFVMLFAVTQALEIVLRQQAAKQLVLRAGIAEELRQLAQGSPEPPRRLRGPHPMQLRAVVADANGVVVYDHSGREGRALSRWERRFAVPIRLEGRVVGYVLPLPVAQLSEEYATVLALLRRVMLLTGLGVALLALFVSVVVSESIAAPLRRLVAASRSIANGRFTEEITAGGPEEVRELARAFAHMAKALRQAEDRRKQLTADIAHELRTPLSVLQGNLAAMLDGIYTASKEELAALYDQVLRLNRLVQDLSELAAFDAGRFSLHVEPVYLPPILATAINLFQAEADAKGIALTAAWPTALPSVLADPSRLGQVLNNLLSNALRHTPQGGTVELGATRDNRSVVVWVSDTGEGIAPEHLPHVFERFWRAEHSRSRLHGGSGLGLPIAKQLVEAMGGEIGVESKPGAGARFWFRLQVAEAQPAMGRQNGSRTSDQRAAEPPTRKVGTAA